MVRARPLSGAERIAVLDPKLRQRDRLPAEELYKILGYLQNFGVEPAIGGVLIYTTENDVRRPDVFHERGGRWARRNRFAACRRCSFYL